ncbi:MAG: hypothetical protein CMK92_06070 [Pseudomonas sp.]|jgi:hypothetical protein|nr:hypothetical protein [Pseudomonas sp.]|tara:strand:+ start:1033 stop:1398 length:366 start_codon:yes stop_codon:yes gene_type:complete
MRGSKKDKKGTVTKEGIVVGRDKKVVVPKEVEKLAKLWCTDKEIAEWFGIDANTLKYNFSDNLLKGRGATKQSLRKAQLKNALEGNTVMQIWLGKQMLGQSDQPVRDEDRNILPWNDDLDL